MEALSLPLAAVSSESAARATKKKKEGHEQLQLQLQQPQKQTCRTDTGSFAEAPNPNLPWAPPIPSDRIPLPSSDLLPSTDPLKSMLCSPSPPTRIPVSATSISHSSPMFPSHRPSPCCRLEGPLQRNLLLPLLVLIHLFSPYRLRVGAESTPRRHTLGSQAPAIVRLLVSDRRDEYTPPAPMLMSPLALEAPPPAVNNASASPAQAPEPPVGSSCCGSNMMRRRGSSDCDCVYPVKLKLFLLNVSLSSNWSNKFLQELASQLQLQVSQFEILDFYVVGTSGLNITMDIAPHKGISFPAHQVHAMNYSLTFHIVHIDEALVGDYKLLNLTWFRPIASSPAPSFMISPASSPHFSSPIPKPPKEVVGKRSSTLILIVCICAAAVVVVAICTIIMCSCTSARLKKRSLAKDPVKTPSMDTSSIGGSFQYPTSTRFIPFEELKEATNNFATSCMLGEGGFGRVYKGVLSDGTAVAIKKLTSGGHQGDKEFLVEVEMLSRLHHRNLVKLIGYYSSRDSSQNLLCYELVPNGSLEAWLHGRLGANCPLDWDTRMKIALDAARGLAYLHEDSQPCVIHRDFKASNILLENNFNAKVSDFGLAKQAPEGRANYLSTRVMGTFGYVAPEYAMTGHLLVKSDVYSYGVVLLELLTGKKPVDMSQPAGQENLVTWARPILCDKDRLEDLADRRLAGKYPKDDFMRVCTIAAACVAPEANQRPTMGEVVQSLKMVQHVVEYQDSTPTATKSHPNRKQSSTTTCESDGISPMFSSGPFSGLSLLDTQNFSRTGTISEDLHEGR